MTEPLKIIALVQINSSEALVLNRPLKMLYEFQGRDLIGSDGPFRDALRYELPQGRFKAFAGREFDIPLKNGGTVRAKGQYWSAGLEGFTETAYGTVDELKKCYVYTGALVDPAALQELRSEYTGCVYPYWEYEKVIKYDDERRYWINKYFKLEDRFRRDKKHLIANVKAATADLRKAEAS
ncbi:hypothetical protein BiPBO1_57 [Brucella phage BiPBO1]|uniref:hypothetical protein n=1 Tax=Brucella phage BiPBO1 TaxID=1718278 RepID=UPI00046D66F7|nr:hypothetical protein [Brucella inopinata]YP_009304085.1 hypothetical protein BJD47_gp57 [Brucella phage BiPBO1]ALJ98271.1 hypothetical protein BiPBO1_57 [Brucella phage BiPBO1]KEY03806.1 hypothetical protein IL59_0214375 [Brucella suis bv. 4 str. 40]